MRDTETEQTAREAVAFDSSDLEGERERMDALLRPLVESFTAIDPADTDAIQEALDEAALIVFAYDHATIEAAIAEYDGVRNTLKTTFAGRAISAWAHSGTPEANRFLEGGRGFPSRIIETAQEQALNAMKGLILTEALTQAGRFAERKFRDEYAALIAGTGRQTMSFPYHKALKPLTDEGFYDELVLTAGGSLNDEEANDLTGGKYTPYLKAARRVERDYERLKEATDADGLLTPDDLLRIWDTLLESLKRGEPLKNDTLIHDLISGFAFEVSERLGTVPELDRIIRTGQLNRFTSNALTKTSSKYLLMVTLCSMGLEDTLRAALRGRKDTKAPIINDHVILTDTKPDKAIFNPYSADYIPVSNYNGEAVTLETGNGMSIQLALCFDLDSIELDNMTMAERAERKLSDDERFYLTALQSIVDDNPEQTRIYGSDILKRWGWNNPTQEHSQENMIEAAGAIERMTNVKVAIDTTNEERRYRKRGKTVKSIQFRPIVDGKLTIEEYEEENGTRVRDFFIDLNADPGKDATSALPTYEYAKSKGQLITADQRVFNFAATTDKNGRFLKAVPQVQKDHRRMMAHIYRHISSKGLGNVIRLDTMVMTLGIDEKRFRDWEEANKGVEEKGKPPKPLLEDKDAKSRMLKKLGQLLDHWKARGIIDGWQHAHEGRKITGIKITPPKKSLKG